MVNPVWVAYGIAVVAFLLTPRRSLFGALVRWAAAWLLAGLTYLLLLFMYSAATKKILEDTKELRLFSRMVMIGLTCLYAMCIVRL